MGTAFIARRRARFESLSGPVNLPYGTEVEAEENLLIHRGRPLCMVTSQSGEAFFCRNDDGMGRERGALTTAITARLERRDKAHQERWNRVWEDPVCRKYQNPDHEDHFLWGHGFFQAPVEDLRHIAALIGARR